MSARTRTLILGASGMLGHELMRMGERLDVWGTVRSAESLRRCRAALPDMELARLVSGVDALDFRSIASAIHAVKPEVVVNCIGIVKQSTAMQQVVPSIELNALLPHRLAEVCAQASIRLVHFSTDCVFSGQKGNYAESDLPDPVDLYGRTKLLGELDQPGCLTLRSSIVGWELQYQRSLLGWFASQRGKRIKGYRRAVFSGVATATMADLVTSVIVERPQLCGIYHVASAPISKFDLLLGLRDALGWSDIEIEPDETVTCNRALQGGRFRDDAGWTPPSWPAMIGALARERAAYERGVLQGMKR